MSQQNNKRAYESGITPLILQEIITGRNLSNGENKLHLLTFNKLQGNVLSTSKVNYYKAVVISLNTSEVNNLEGADFSWQIHRTVVLYRELTHGL